MLSLLREDVTSSFSDLWYRVGPTRPSLSPHAQVSRQRFGGQTSHVIEDPAGGQYYRLSDSAYFFVGLLDGRRTVDAAWQACNAQLGDLAPTQRECVDLLSRLQLFGLLSGDLPLAPEMVELRRREAASRRVQRRTGRGVSMTIPLVNPEPWLERSKHLLRIVFSRWGLLAWVLVVGFAVYRIAINHEALSDGLNGALDPSNLVWIGVVFIFLRVWHELGHACACKAMGARCTEIGIMIIALVLPFPYCDTSSAWRLQEVWRRVVVSAGGVLFETFVAALAGIAWSFLTRQDSGLERTLLYNIMLISGVTTLVFNLNPLLRYDGYYILSDVAGAANLAQRSQELLRFLVQRYVFRVSSARPPAVRSRGELCLLICFALFSTPYRLIVMFSIVLVLWSSTHYLTLGVVIAAVTGAMWIVWPLLQGVGYLATSPQLVGRRARAIALVSGACLLLGAVLGAVPMPAGGFATGTVEPQVFEPIRPTEDGFVQQVHVRAGDLVRKGDPLVTLFNGEVRAALAGAEAAAAGAQVEVDSAAAGAGTNRVQADIRLRHAQLNLDHARDRAEALVVRARAPGRIVPDAGMGADMDSLTGQFIQRGTLLGSVISEDRLLVRCLVADRDEGYIFRGRAGEEVAGVRASVRVKGRAGEEIEARVDRVTPAGSRRVGAESLTTQAGGEVVTEPSDSKKTTAVTPQWVVDVVPQDATPETIQRWKPGLRARVRFGLAPEPLGEQWWRRLRQYLADKAQS